MKLQYLKNVVSLELNVDKCIGCGMCVTVCPHRIFQLNNEKAEIIDRDACMECGACSRNCPVDAISVKTGVGCAAAVIQGFIQGTEPVCDCGCGQNSKGC